jgi:hypothetical protein
MSINILTLRLSPRLVISTLLLLCALPGQHLQAQEIPPERQLEMSEQVSTLPGKPKRFALIIGVDEYADTQITTLGGASNDAKLLADALIRYAGFPIDQVTILASDQPAERKPTRGNILRRLSNLRTAVPKDGLLLISFAGHGIEREKQAFLLPSDAQVSNDVDLLEETAINVMQMKERIRKTGVQQVILILDACRNDPVGRSDTDNPLTSSYTRGFNFDVRNREVIAFATLYATEIGYRAYEYKEKKHGYFTWSLVEGLKGGAANEKGEITLAGLVNYLQDFVPKKVRLDLGTGKEQKPFADIGGYKASELVIAVTALPSSVKTETNENITSNPVAEFGETILSAPWVSLSEWEAPGNWNVSSRKLIINGKGIATPRSGYYRFYTNFQLTSDVKMANAIAVSFALRMIDRQNYYLIQITGDKSQEPYVLRAFVINNGVTIKQLGKSIPIDFAATTLKPDQFFTILLKMQENSLNVQLMNSETGQVLTLGTLNDPDNHFPIGGVGIVATNDEQNEVGRFFVCGKTCSQEEFVTGSFEGRVVNGATGTPLFGQIEHCFATTCWP